MNNNRKERLSFFFEEWSVFSDLTPPHLVQCKTGGKAPARESSAKLIGSFNSDGKLLFSLSTNWGLRMAVNPNRPNAGRAGNREWKLGTIRSRCISTFATWQTTPLIKLRVFRIVFWLWWRALFQLSSRDAKWKICNHLLPNFHPSMRGWRTHTHTIDHFTISFGNIKTIRSGGRVQSEAKDCRTIGLFKYGGKCVLLDGELVAI